MINMILISSDEFNPRSNDLARNMIPAGPIDIEKQRTLCRELTGSDTMPAVIYKGRLIERGTLGFRSFKE